MVVLKIYPGIWGMPSLSPFCSKVYYFLKQTEIPFECRYVNNPKLGPKGKFPVIEYEGKTIADSEHILDYCIATFNINLSDSLADHALRRMVEEHLYFVILASRWLDPANKVTIFSAFKPFFPNGLAKMALPIIRALLKKQALAQGLGRHNLTEIYDKGLADLKAIDDYLNARQENEVKLIDFTLFPFLQVIQQTPIKVPMRQFCLESKPIQHYLKNFGSTRL